MAGFAQAMSDDSDVISEAGNAAIPSLTAPAASLSSGQPSNAEDQGPAQNSADVHAEEEAGGSEAVEKELRELLGKMEESYKDFSETVFKKMDGMREKIALLDESVVDLNEGLEGLEALESPTNSGKSRPAMQRKRRA